MKSSFFREVIKTRRYRTSLKRNKTFETLNWETSNKVLINNPYSEGIKTGITKNAGSCQATIFTYAGKTLMILVLGCRTPEGRFKETELLWHWATEKYSDLKDIPISIRN